MNLRNLFRFSGVILGLGGLVWLLAPQSMAGAVGYAIDSYDAYLIRALGANNIAWAVLAVPGERVSTFTGAPDGGDFIFCAHGSVPFCEPFVCAYQHS